MATHGTDVSVLGDRYSSVFLMGSMHSVYDFD